MDYYNSPGTISGRSTEQIGIETLCGKYQRRI